MGERKNVFPFISSFCSKSLVWIASMVISRGIQSIEPSASAFRRGKSDWMHPSKALGHQIIVQVLSISRDTSIALSHLLQRSGAVNQIGCIHSIEPSASRSGAINQLGCIRSIELSASSFRRDQISQIGYIQSIGPSANRFRRGKSDWIHP